IVVNLQGDEPLVPIALPARLAAALAADDRAGIATCATPIRDVRDVLAPQVVKVVLDRRGHALYFSRAPIPFARDAFASGAPDVLPEGVPYLRHLGLYAYRAGTLRELAAAPQVASERAESLEQLRALELGIGISVTILDEAPPPGVDTAEDLERVREVLGR
nr:3-deoxy-manno-octulosonate cytidylyltransferase [Myxococcota bacterium]